MVRRCNDEKDKEVLRQIAAKLGPQLVQDHGKKKNYTKQEIDQSKSTLNIPFDFECWAYCMFMEHGAFDQLHRSMGEVCDFVAMKTEMLSLVPKKVDASWFDFDWDLSDLDPSKIFKMFD